MSSRAVTIKKHKQIPKRVSVTTSKKRMISGQSSSQEHLKEEKDNRPSSILSTGSRQLKKNVSFSDRYSVYLIPKQPVDESQHRGYILDTKRTFMNLLDTTSLLEVDEDSEVELRTVLCDEGLDLVEPNDSPISPEDKSDVIVCCSSQVTAFGGQQETFPVGLPKKQSISPSTESATKPVRLVSFRSSIIDPYLYNNEGLNGSRLNRKAVDETKEEKRCLRLKDVCPRTTVKDSEHSLNKRTQDEGNIGSRTCEAIKDYIVGLSGHRSSNRLSSVDLVPVYVAVKGTLSKKVIRKESTTKNKRGLDLVGTHTLRNQNINCAIRFYYDKDAKEIAESRMLRQ